MSFLSTGLAKMRQLHFNPSQLRSRLVQNMVGTFGLRITNVGLTFITSIILARLMGVAGYGAYVYAMTWITLLGVVATFGLDKLLMRSVAAYLAQTDWSLLRGILRWSSGVVLLVSSALTLTMFIMVWLVWRFAPGLDETTQITLLIALWMLPLWAITRLWQFGVWGFDRVVSGQLIEFIVRPLLFVLLLIGVYWGWGSSLTAPVTMILQVAASAMAVLLALWFLRQALPGDVMTAVPTYQSTLWLAAAWPLLLSNTLEVVNVRADILLLGSLHGTEAVGIYNVAKRLAELVTFVLIAVNMSIGPRIATLYAMREIAALQKLVTKSVRLIFWGSLALAAGLLIFSPWVLLIWGTEFAEGYPTLAILVVAQMVNAAMGPVGLVLIMTRHERDMVWGVGAGLIVNVCFNLLLIPRWGAPGTAVATLLATITWNVLLVILAYRRLGIYTFAFAPQRTFDDPTVPLPRE
jgi:O-antigen/teichoic acid export membrane protein